MIFNEHLRTIDDFPVYTVDIEGNIYNNAGLRLKQHVNSNGYKQVMLCKNGYQKFCSVHRIVAKAFLPCDDYSLEVNHLDGNKLNNAVSNLEWCTRSHNLKHAYANGLKTSYLTYEDRIKGNQISVEQFKKRVLVTDTGEIYRSVRDCAMQIGGDISAISRCCNGLLNSHHGHHFEFID